VRELRDTMEGLVLHAPGPNLTAADLRQCRVNGALEAKPHSEQQITLRF
jgi:hypothetical protein